jgi:hypothetical protein
VLRCGFVTPLHHHTTLHPWLCVLFECSALHTRNISLAHVPPSGEARRPGSLEEVSELIYKIALIFYDYDAWMCSKSLVINLLHLLQHRLAGMLSLTACTISPSLSVNQ